MAKPTRYSRADRYRKRVGIHFPLRVGALLRQRQAVSQLHIQKAILAAAALHRCVELESFIRDFSEEAAGGQSLPPETYLPRANAILATPLVVTSKADRDTPDQPKLQQRLNHMEWRLRQKDETIASLYAQLAEVKAELFLQTARGEPHDGC